MSALILYGRGLIAEEYCRYLLSRGREVTAFAVTALAGQGAIYCGRPCMEIGEALAKYPEVEIHLALQEKYHAEVVALLKEMGRSPRAVIGLHRMTELLGEQGIKEISAACPELIVGRNPHDYSMLEITSREQPGNRYTFYPMTQVPLSFVDIENLRKIAKTSPKTDSMGQSLPLEGALRRGSSVDFQAGDREAVDEVLFVAMATSARDAKVSHENLPSYVHPVLGGAATYDGPRNEEIAYDDELTGNISRHNNLYSELTVAYWLSQKAPRAKYLGLCHYRRHFVLRSDLKKQLDEGTVDVLLTTSRLTFPTVHAYFASLPVTTMDELDYETMLSLIEKEDSGLAKFSRNYLERQIHFPNNMLIAKREIYLAYCKFMFAVLQGMQEKYAAEGIERPDRYLGYVGELLTTVYFAYHRDKWCTAFIDYQLLKEL